MFLQKQRNERKNEPTQKRAALQARQQKKTSCPNTPPLWALSDSGIVIYICTPNQILWKPRGPLFIWTKLRNNTTIILQACLIKEKFGANITFPKNVNVTPLLLRLLPPTRNKYMWQCDPCHIVLLWVADSKCTVRKRITPKLKRPKIKCQRQRRSAGKMRPANIFVSAQYDLLRRYRRSCWVCAQDDAVQRARHV